MTPLLKGEGGERSDETLRGDDETIRPLPPFVLPFPLVSPAAEVATLIDITYGISPFIKIYDL